MQLKRNNLKLHNIKEDATETRDSLTASILTYFKDTLKLNTDAMTFDDVYRIPGNKGTRPVLMRFSQYRDRESVLRAFRQIRRAGSSDLGFRVSEDLPSRISRARTGLYPLLQQGIEDGKRSYFKYDKLVVGDDVFEYDESQKKAVPAEK